MVLLWLFFLGGGMKKSISGWVCLMVLMMTATAGARSTQEITDAAGRTSVIPEKIDYIICSGPGCLRLVSYLGAQDLVVGVDDIETGNNKFDARPYAFANPKFKRLPVFGGFRGQDIPEKILGLSPLPQVIFKTYAATGYDPVKLSKKTKIPVITLEYGDLGQNRQALYQALTLLGQALNRQDRAREVIAFFDSQIRQLADRTGTIPDIDKKTCFVGGIAYKGPHGFQSTEPGYPPFQFVTAKNIAKPGPTEQTLAQSNFSREKLLVLNPDVLFLDLSTLQMGENQGGLYELKHDPVFQGLGAVGTEEVYGVLPYNWYTQNFGSILADAWFIGKILYPKQFFDIVPDVKADEIYTFLLSKPLFRQMNASFKHLAFKRIDLN
jgi:iron complex transport system substrate-binding protein